MDRLGNWITNKTAVPFYARKQFEVKGAVKSAKARVCGLGQFHFYMNGHKVEDHELDPGWTNYRKLIEYVTFDVKEYLKKGMNMLGAEVGNGWFIMEDEHYTFHFPPFMPPNPNPYRAFGKYLVLAMELEICYEDGTTQRIVSDETFRVREHPVVMSNVYGSETIDGRKAVKDWCVVKEDKSEACGSVTCEESFNNPLSTWQDAIKLPEEECPSGRLIEQFQPPVRVIHTYEGKYLHTYEGKKKERAVNEKNRCSSEAEQGGTGLEASEALKTLKTAPRQIYDFGQNMSGILEFEVKGKAGDEIRLFPAEKLTPDGDVDQMAKGWVAVDSCITYIIGQDDVWETCRMRFTYFAGRYVAVEGADFRDGGCSIRNLKADAISSAFVRNGSFECDDVRYMQVYDLVEKAVEANMVSVHTDCPTIERFAWQEPNHLMAPSIFYMKDGKKLWEKFLLDMRTDQHTADDYFYDYEGGKVYPGEGLMPSQCPCYIPNVLPVPGMGSFYDIIPWGSTCILGTYWHYQFYGDVKIIEDNYDAGMRYLEHLKSRVNEDGFLNHGLGDWGNPKNELSRENIETVFLYADTVTLAKFADILGKTPDQVRLNQYADEIKENYNEKLLVRHPEEGFWCYRSFDHPGETFLTQAGQALPLFWGLVPEKIKEDVVQALRYTLEKEEAFICGEVGLPYVIQSAREYGMNDLISRFIMREEHPGYYAFVLDGETTLGEYWETNPRSHCHDMMGHIIEWYYNGIAGIMPKQPGFSQVLVKPYLPDDLHRFVCSYQSVCGKISVEVLEEENRIYLTVSAPEKIKVEIDTSNLKSRGKEVAVVNEKTCC